MKCRLHKRQASNLRFFDSNVRPINRLIHGIQNVCDGDLLVFNWFWDKQMPIKHISRYTLSAS
jgi:hypothetical protein